MDRWIDRQINRCMERQIDRQIDKIDNIDRQIIYVDTDRQIDR